jgi:hypothetical protein
MTNRTITLDAATHLFNTNIYKDLTHVANTARASYTKLSQDQFYKVITTNVYLKNNHDDYFYFTVVETPDNTFILNKDYPTVTWYARNRKALVELFPCSKEDIGVYPEETDTQQVEDPEVTAFLNYLMGNITENFNLSKEESKELKDSLSEKLTATNYKNI